MKTAFYIELSLKTPDGPEPYGRFYIGNNREKAYNLFHMLHGTDHVNDKNVLYIDLMETVQGLPVNLKMISCTLEQLALNCRTITKKLFSAANLEVK